MQEIFQYLVKCSIALAAVYLFYKFALRALTFYQWNRRYLVAYSLAALFIPLVNVYSYVPEQQLQQNQLVKFIPVIQIGQQQQAATSGSINFWTAAGILVLAGSLILFSRLVMQWFSLRRIRRNATRIYHAEAKVYHVEENVIPFSFGDAIYVNTSLHTEQELNDIILHEFVHVRQKHSFDIIWSEILCVINWYNPFAWLIRHAIRQNLEFIADHAVLDHGLDKKAYQYHLLKVIGSSQYSIANNFNFSSLKTRIAMMNRLKSAKLHLVKFLFVLPLLAVMLLAFRNNKSWYQDIKTDTIKKPDAAGLSAMKEVMKQGFKFIALDKFYKQNSGVKEVAWSSGDEIVLYLKNGNREVYDSNKESDLKKLAAAYGGIPAVSPIIPSVIDPADMPAPPPPPATPGLPTPPAAPKLPAGAVSIVRNNEVLTITFKNGKTEVYHLDKPSEKAAAEKKYGGIIEVEKPAVPKVIEVEQVNVVRPGTAVSPAVEVPAVVEKANAPATVNITAENATSTKVSAAKPTINVVPWVKEKPKAAREQ